MTRPALTCAIYTRKSSEEGLEQGFNSLDAQREACEAFVLSQRHEGWKVLKECYDDAGYSGGTMERPALKRLLEDIDKKRVQVVVVYKVDRLTRSLADFAKIVERFDAQDVSFVSVTQQFNTTSSMGRLTLNVLLSFAQFEREVTGERIRDKIAASKQKGMWMGGTPPIGYQGHERTLSIDEQGAELVRHIYARYVALGCVRKLKLELDASGIVSPIRTFKAGRAYGGRQFGRGQLYRILSNPIYLGQIVHRDKVYPGQHPAIIPRDLWDAVQVMMAGNRQGYKERRSVPSASLLTGLVVDANGNRLIPSHSQKQSKRYRYYVSEPLITKNRDHAPDGIRLPAQELETLVIDHLCRWLTDAHAVLDALHIPEAGSVQTIVSHANGMAKVLEMESDERYRLIQRLITQVIVGPDSVQIIIRTEALLPDIEDTNGSANHRSVTLTVPVKVRRCGFGIRLLIQGANHAQRQEPDTRLIQQVAKAHDLLGKLTSGKVKSIAELSQTEGIVNSTLTRMIYRAFLAPDIVRAIVDGTQPASLTLDNLKQYLPLPIDWDAQRKLLGFTQP